VFGAMNRFAHVFAVAAAVAVELRFTEFCEL
jgi:hypothetical protein